MQQWEYLFVQVVNCGEAIKNEKGRVLEIKYYTAIYANGQEVSIQKSEDASLVMPQPHAPNTGRDIIPEF